MNFWWLVNLNSSPMLLFHWPAASVVPASDAVGDDGSEGQIRSVKKLSGSLVPFKLTRRLKTGISTPRGPLQFTAKRQDGKTALTFLLLLSTECLGICRMAIRRVSFLVKAVLLLSLLVIYMHTCNVAKHAREFCEWKWFSGSTSDQNKCSEEFSNNHTNSSKDKGQFAL